METIIWSFPTKLILLYKLRLYKNFQPWRSHKNYDNFSLCWYRWLTLWMNETSSELPRRSSAILSYFQKSFAIFGHLRNGNVRGAFGQCLKNIRKSSGNGRKSSENRERRSLSMFFSRVQFCIPLVRFRVALKIWRGIPSQWLPMYYSFCTDCYAVHYVSTAFKTLRMAAHSY